MYEYYRLSDLRNVIDACAFWPLYCVGSLPVDRCEGSEGRKGGGRDGFDENDRTMRSFMKKAGGRSVNVSDRPLETGNTAEHNLLSEKKKKKGACA
jgi:hypothetical protein